MSMELKRKWRVFWLWDFDKEERWLNEMASQGWQLRHPGFCNYLFEKGKPGEYVYRLEMLDNWPTSAAGHDYIAFVESTGAQYIGSLMRWVYFRKEAAASPFDMFSDLGSRIKHLSRILLLAGVLALLLLVNGINIYTGALRGYIVPIPLLVIYGLLGLLLLYGIARLFLIRRRLLKAKAFRE